MKPSRQDVAEVLASIESASEPSDRSAIYYWYAEWERESRQRQLLEYRVEMLTHCRDAMLTRIDTLLARIATLEPAEKRAEKRADRMGWMLIAVILVAAACLMWRC